MRLKIRDSWVGARGIIFIGVGEPLDIRFDMTVTQPAKGGKSGFESGVGQIYYVDDIVSRRIDELRLERRKAILHSSGLQTRIRLGQAASFKTVGTIRRISAGIDFALVGTS
jgi:hypothetical protein